ncbi:hypothetical protein L3X38_010958 [Prunus dulcis]|uniref:Uncharacterized protein n=1 Tax=Prunus dulcis TaxID=3755 RepID=A0AAD4WJ90_PRUDU|nr:hypothetical protein L3X38_010958 [Prunus dulcis]
MCIEEVYLEKDWPFWPKDHETILQRGFTSMVFRPYTEKKVIQEALDKKLPVLCCVQPMNHLRLTKRYPRILWKTCMTCGEDVWSWCNKLWI